MANPVPASGPHQVRNGDRITYYLDGEIVMVATIGTACRTECPPITATQIAGADSMWGGL